MDGIPGVHHFGDFLYEIDFELIGRKKMVDGIEINFFSIWKYDRRGMAIILTGNHDHLFSIK